MILKSENLQKKFNNKTVLKNVDFEVSEGEIHAILGKNGAGKSTFIKIALGLISPTAGDILLFGSKPGIFNNRIGYLSENITLYPHLSAKDNLRVAAYTSNNSLTNEQISEIFKRIDLTGVGNKPTKTFSLGMKRRLQLAMSTMVKKVDFLILDEPTNGLDVNGLLWLKSYINELRSSGVSILLASHAIFDLQECITDYVIFNQGVIAKSGKWGTERCKSTGVVITVSSDVKQKTLNIIDSVNSDYYFEGTGEITWTTDKSYKEICELLYKNGIFPEKITEIKNSLEDVFIEYVKERGV